MGIEIAEKTKVTRIEQTIMLGTQRSLFRLDCLIGIVRENKSQQQIAKYYCIMHSKSEWLFNMLVYLILASLVFCDLYSHVLN